MRTTQMWNPEDGTFLGRSVPTRPSGKTTHGTRRLLGAVRKFWKDQQYLQERLLAAQRPWDTD